MHISKNKIKILASKVECYNCNQNITNFHDRTSLIPYKQNNIWQTLYLANEGKNRTT